MQPAPFVRVDAAPQLAPYYLTFTPKIPWPHGVEDTSAINTVY